MADQTVEAFSQEIANRIADASAQIQRTQTRRESLKKCGRPVKDDEPQGSLVVDSIHRHRPFILSDVPDTPENANQILCAFMFSAMEILAGIAENRRVPVGLRKEAAKILIDSGLSTVPKRVQTVSASLNAKNIEDFARMFDRVDPDQLARALQEEPGSKIEELPALGRMKRLTSGAGPVRLGLAKPEITVEDKILEVVSRFGLVSLKEITARVRMLADARKGPWQEILQGLVDRGILEITAGMRGGKWYRFSTKPSEQKEEA